MANKTNKKSEHTTEKCTGDISALEDTLYVIGGKWKLKIISVLRTNGTSRFNQLQQAVTGISARLLSKELKELELNGFVKRTVYSDFPVTITYEVTSYSDTLGPLLNEIVKWGVQHKEKIRKDYADSRK